MKKILAIETSCDETAAALVIGDPNTKKLQIKSNIVASQIDLHNKYGGVYPELASRAHTENILPVIEDALEGRIDQAMESIDAIAVTYGPGLVGSLTVGVAAAKTLAYVFKKPIIPINHWEGHLYSLWFNKRVPEFPALFLTVSGGHTSLILMKDHGKYELLGQTLDDAAGEAFDKVARILGLGYPGGPAISQEAKKAPLDIIFDLPRPMTDKGELNFSFSGLKTAVLYKIRELERPEKGEIAAMARSFQEAITDTLIIKLSNAVKTYKPKSICLTGGVAANEVLREKFEKIPLHIGSKIPTYMPELKLTTDNASMVAAAGFFNLLGDKTTEWYNINVDAGAKLVE